MYKIMISVGEASGDLNGASLANALKIACPEIKIFGMGGQAMRDAGVDIIYDIADLGVIGFVEVIKNLPRLFKLRDMLGDIMDKERPDALVVIDYPGFNTRLSKVAKKKGIPIISYISPTAWAWGKGRAKGVAETVDKVAAIFPFEADVYREAGADVTYVGHPLVDIVKPSMKKEESYSYFKADPEKPIVLLMPGSRKQEITSLLPDMLEACEKVSRKVPDCQFFLPIASTISQEMLQDIINNYKVTVKLTNGYNYDLMSIADVGIAASGTVTLEAALVDLPTVIIYKVAATTYFLGKLLVKIPFISLPNIIADRQIMPELLQGDVNADAIARYTLEILLNKGIKSQMQADLAEVRDKLGECGAVSRVADIILSVAAKHSGGR